jgi:serine/threonine protein kinase
MEQIGPYRILRKLGEGGMGVVYAAADERLNRAVAIKTIRESVDSSARERFFREARAAASLSHPNVCQLEKALDAHVPSSALLPANGEKVPKADEGPWLSPKVKAIG